MLQIKCTMLYRYRRSRGSNIHGELPARYNLPFNEFVLSLCADPKAKLRHRRLCSDDKKLLVKTLLRVETLGADFAALTRRIFGTPIKLPQLNVSPGDPAGRSYSEEAIAAVRRICWLEFEECGYPDRPDVPV